MTFETYDKSDKKKCVSESFIHSFSHSVTRSHIELSAGQLKNLSTSLDMPAFFSSCWLIFFSSTYQKMDGGATWEFQVGGMIWSDSLRLKGCNPLHLKKHCGFQTTFVNNIQFPCQDLPKTDCSVWLDGISQKCERDLNRGSPRWSPIPEVIFLFSWL